MKKEEIVGVFYGKEKVEIYREFQKIEKDIESSNEIYQYFDDIKEMLLDEKSYVRVRGFRVICKLAKWDSENMINKNIEQILNELDDDKPTAVRQCLANIEYLLKYKPELKEIVKKKLEKIDYSKYEDTMSPLIKKDVDKLLCQL